MGDKVSFAFQLSLPRFATMSNVTLSPLRSSFRPRLLDGRDRDEQVLAATAVVLNKTITLRRAKPFRCSAWHVVFLPQGIKGARLERPGLIILNVGRAQTGPCNTGGKDAGSGPTPGATGQTITTGSADTKAHPPTETMNNVAGDKAMSSQDAQRQQQDQPTAAQQA
jgi:hypothetical protein